MGLFKRQLNLFLLLALLVTAKTAALEDQASNQILFLMKSGQLHRALEMYDNLYKNSGSHRIELLRELGLQILFEGSHVHDPEILLMTLYGAGISTNERTLPILEEGLISQSPQHQLVALNFLARLQNDRADKALMNAMRSDFLPIRLEAAFILCEKQYPGAVGQAESLMHKVPQELLHLFPQLYAASGNYTSTRLLKQLMNHANSDVRVSTILSVAKAGRDDLLPQIRTLLTQLDNSQQEACAYAVGLFKDQQSLPRLQQLKDSRSLHVKLAALNALHRLGDSSADHEIIHFAKEGSLFAITLLSDIPGSDPLLSSLMKSPDANIRINASLALLKKRNSQSVAGLEEILLHNSRDLAFTKVQSQGHTLTAWKAIPSASQNLKNDPIQHELSLAMRESVLTECLELPEENFLSIAHALLNARQNDLVPMTIYLLENAQTTQAVDLLKLHSQQIGAPLIRNYCNLALYRLEEKGPYYENLKAWIEEQMDLDFIKFRPLVPTNLRESAAAFNLTPNESSRLLIEAFESFVRTHDARGIDILLDAIRYGNPKNRFALAGLLIQTTL